jgi:hypothetical protein
MPSSEDILKEKLKRLQTVPADFIDEVVKNQGKIFNDVLDALSKLEVDSSGNILLSDKNFSLIEIIGEDFKKAIYDSGYEESVTGFVKEFGKQKNLNKTYLSQTVEGFENKSIYDKTYEQSTKNAVDILAENAVNENVTAFKDVLNQSISNSGNFNELLKTLKTNIEGSPEVDGALSKYAKTYANDLYSVAERNYQTTVSKDLGLVFALYAGGEMDTTRCFCEERHGKIYHIEEIKSWGKGENLGNCNIGGGKWAGMNKNTNENTIFSVLGGYNCNHSLVYKGIKDVPKSVILRAIQKGYLKADDLPASVRKYVGV